MARIAASAAAFLGLLAVAAGAAPTSYQGAYYGRTAQGKAMSFVVSAGDRVTKLVLAYSLPGCDVKQSINTSVPINGGSFTFSLNVPSNKLSITGRFGASVVTGTLGASSDCGQMRTTWRAAKGHAPAAPKPAPTKPKTPPKPAPPAPDRFDGIWEGNATLPGGLDPELTDTLESRVMISVFDGAVESLEWPLLIKGAGCSTGEFGDKEFGAPVKLKGNGFTLAFKEGGVGVKVVGTFDSLTRAHGTISQTGSFEGCSGVSTIPWRMTNS
jgi:hypothetical protein